MTDKRILPGERADDGACAACGRRHIHADDCAVLKDRERRDGMWKPVEPDAMHAAQWQRKYFRGDR